MLGDVGRASRNQTEQKKFEDQLSITTHISTMVLLCIGLVYSSLKVPEHEVMIKSD